MKAWPRHHEVRSSGWSGAEARIGPECICWPVENPWSYYGIVEPGGALEPNPECPLHFPPAQALSSSAKREPDE